MKALLILLLSLGIATWVGLGLKQDPGMLVITLADWRLDMPLWLAVLCAIVLIYALSLLWVLVKKIINVPGFFSKYSRQFHKKQAKQATHKGLISLAEGHWQHAEKWLMKGATYHDLPWINYFFAAKAAQKLEHYNKRDDYLAKAVDAYPESEIAIGITRAQWLFDQKDYAQSLKILKMLQHKSPYHPALLKLLQKIYIENGHWEAARALLSDIKRNHVYASKDLKPIELKIYKALLLENSTENAQKLNEIWQKIPKEYRTQSDLALSYAQILHKKHLPQDAETVLRHALRQTWREDLISLYGLLSHPQPEKLYTQAEEWLHTHTQSPGLLLTLGRLSEQLQLWGKAQRYYEASLVLQPSPQAYLALGHLLETLNDKSGAHYYKKGLMLLQSEVVLI